MRLTTARYYTTSGRSIQALAITPDVLTNQGGTGTQALPPRSDLPPVAKQIPEKPPENFPKFDATKPDATDFQLQQAVALAQAMAAQKSASAN